MRSQRHPDGLDLIGVHGPLNGGKDTVATYLQAKFPDRFGRYAFARPLKEACEKMFGFSMEQMEDRVLKEQVDPFWGFTPRKALQLLGTEYGRGMLRDDVWIRRAEQELMKNSKSSRGMIITDVRFPNEAEWIRDKDNAVLLYLDVPGLKRDERYNHASEAGIDFDNLVDIKIVNDKSKGLEHLFKQIDEIFFN
jgi:hypothetical protein